MTIGPDDLPEDPFGPGGLAMEVCGCTSETMHLIRTRTTRQVRCAACKTLMAEFPAEPLTAPGERTTIDLPQEYRRTGLPQVGASWGNPPTIIPPEPPLRGPAPAEPPPYTPGPDAPPPLPAFSTGMCNAYLNGGPYDGQITWIMAGPGVEFAIKGVGTYLPTRNTMDGRIVYTWAG